MVVGQSILFYFMSHENLYQWNSKKIPNCHGWFTLQILDLCFILQQSLVISIFASVAILALYALSYLNSRTSEYPLVLFIEWLYTHAFSQNVGYSMLKQCIDIFCSAPTRLRENTFQCIFSHSNVQGKFDNSTHFSQKID